VNGCYKAINRNLDWSAAGLECGRLHEDAHLLVINDAAEQRAVERWIESMRGQCAVLHSLAVAVNKAEGFKEQDRQQDVNLESLTRRCACSEPLVIIIIIVIFVIIIIIVIITSAKNVSAVVFLYCFIIKISHNIVAL